MKIIILAGGKGTRLWPISRENFPKQFLRIDNNKSLFFRAIERALTIVAKESIVISSGESNFLHIKRELRETPISESNIILRPENFETAAAILYSLLKLKNEFNVDGNEIICLLPSDHIIEPLENFKQSVEKAYEIALRDYIVIFGIKPNFAFTGYGYIKIGKKQDNFFLVDKFKEKPNLEEAEEYVRSGEYLWNSGIFLFKLDLMLSEFKNYAPNLFNEVVNLNKTITDSFEKSIIEKSEKLALILANFNWVDVGSWSAFYEIQDKNDKGNVEINDVITYDVSNSLIIGGKRTVAVVGLSDIIVIDYDDAVLIAGKNSSDKVKILVETLKNKGKTDLLIHKPLVSIITQVFTYRDYLKTAVKSVLTQTYPYIEYIIVDYGNREDWKKELREVIDKYKDNNKIVHIIEETSWPGVYPAMNRGIEEATGDIIGILNADDYYFDNTVIETIVETFEKNNTDVCWGDIVYVKRDNPDVITRFWKTSPYHPGDYLKGWQAPHPGFFVKRLVYEKYGVYRTDIPIAADYEFMLRVLEKYQVKHTYVSKIMVKMREGGESNWKSLFKILKGNYNCYKAQRLLNLKTNPFIIFIKPLKKVKQLIIKHY